MTNQPVLTELSEDAGEAFADYARDFLSHGDSFRQDSHRQVIADWPAYFQERRRFAEGRDLAPGVVQQLEYMLMREGRILGAGRLRLQLNEALLISGGHIGYDVRPSERGKGHATMILRLMLEKAREQGLARVLLTCDKENVASARVIEKCGGVLENEAISPHNGRPCRRYWIDLTSGQAGETTGAGHGYE